MPSAHPTCIHALPYIHLHLHLPVLVPIHIPVPVPAPCPWPCPTCPVLPALPYLPCPTCPTLPALPCHACHPSPSKVHSYINNPPSSSNTTPPQPFHRHQPTIPSSPVPTPGPRRLDSQIHLTVKGNGITEGNGKVREGKCEGRRGKGDVKYGTDTSIHLKSGVGSRGSGEGRGEERRGGEGATSWGVDACM